MSIAQKLGVDFDLSDTLGITSPAPPDVSKSPDAEQLRRFSTKLAGEYSRRVPGQEQTVGAQTIGAPTIDQAQADAARQTMAGNIAGLEAVAGGAPTAADAMLTRGTDAARRNATGLAAAYSRSNPGLALRAGLTAGNQAQAEANAVAAQQKMTEQAAARDRIGALAGAMRGQDIGVASNQAQLEAEARARNQAAALEAARANQAAQLQQQQVNNQYEIQKGNSVETALLGPMNTTLANQQIQQQNNAANQQGMGALYTAAGGALKLSDERAKDNVRTSKLADAMARGIRGVSFKYKPGKDDGGEHVGVLAQDVERTIPGVVKKRGDGMKVVDTGHLTLAHTGAISELARRLRDVEARA